MLDDPRDRLAVMLAQLRDRDRWPPPPPRSLTPMSDAEVVARVVPVEELIARAWRPIGAGPVAGDGDRVERD